MKRVQCARRERGSVGLPQQPAPPRFERTDKRTRNNVGSLGGFYTYRLGRVRTAGPGNTPPSVWSRLGEDIIAEPPFCFTPCSSLPGGIIASEKLNSRGNRSCASTKRRCKA